MCFHVVTSFGVLLTIVKIDKISTVINNKEPEIKNAVNNYRSQYLITLNGNKENNELNTALKRRRQRFARQAHQIMQQQELFNNPSALYELLDNSYEDSNGIKGSSNNTPNGKLQEDDSIYKTMKNYNITDFSVNGLFIIAIAS